MTTSCRLILMGFMGVWLDMGMELMAQPVCLWLDSETSTLFWYFKLQSREIVKVYETGELSGSDNFNLGVLTVVDIL